MTRLRLVLWLVAISQLVLGTLTLFVPAQFFELIGLSTPPLDNRYMIGMLGARFLAFGVGLAVLARQDRPAVFWIWTMVGIQMLDLTLGLFYTATGGVALSSSAFPMFNAALFALLLSVFTWSYRAPATAPQA